jgi:hypothetical protein
MSACLVSRTVQFKPVEMRARFFPPWKQLLLHKLLLYKEDRKVVAQAIFWVFGDQNYELFIVCFSNMKSQQQVTRCISGLKRNCWIK